MPDSEKTIHLLCECGLHIMQVETIVETHCANRRCSQDWNFAFFDYYGMGKPSLRNRIGIAWKYLKTGKMHGDHVVLSVDDAKRLADFINENNFGKQLINKTK